MSECDLSGLPLPPGPRERPKQWQEPTQEEAEEDDNDDDSDHVADARKGDRYRYVMPRPAGNQKEDEEDNENEEAEEAEQEESEEEAEEENNRVTKRPSIEGRRGGSGRGGRKKPEEEAEENNRVTKRPSREAKEEEEAADDEDPDEDEDEAEEEDEEAEEEEEAAEEAEEEEEEEEEAAEEEVTKRKRKRPSREAKEDAWEAQEDDDAWPSFWEAQEEEKDPEEEEEEEEEEAEEEDNHVTKRPSREAKEEEEAAEEEEEEEELGEGDLLEEEEEAEEEDPEDEKQRRQRNTSQKVERLPQNLRSLMPAPSRPAWDVSVPTCIVEPVPAKKRPAAAPRQEEEEDNRATAPAARASRDGPLVKEMFFIPQPSTKKTLKRKKAKGENALMQLLPDEAKPPPNMSFDRKSWTVVDSQNGRIQVLFKKQMFFIPTSSRNPGTADFTNAKGRGISWGKFSSVKAAWKRAPGRWEKTEHKARSVTRHPTRGGELGLTRPEYPTATLRPREAS